MARTVRYKRWMIRLALGLILLTLGLILGVKAVGWRQPKPMPKQVHYLSPYADGSLILVKSTPVGNWMLKFTVPVVIRMQKFGALPEDARLLGIILYDWEGRVRWHIKVPDVSRTTVFRQDYVVFSPDSRCAALALPEKTQVRLLAWRSGKLVMDTRFPTRSPSALTFIEGRGQEAVCRLVENTQPTCTLSAFDGNRVIATGTHTSLLKAPPGTIIGQAIASNGSALMTYLDEDGGRRVSGPDVEYAALQVSGKSIVFTNCYALKAIGGTLLDDSASWSPMYTYYNAKGRIARKSRLACGGVFGDSVLMVDDLTGKWLVINPGNLRTALADSHGH